LAFLVFNESTKFENDVALRNALGENFLDVVYYGDGEKIL